MGATQVAEGPLIKHVPGGFAEWRAKESGLPPARLHSSEGEWWGKLVGPTDTTDPDPILGGVGDVDDSGVDTSGGYIGSDFKDEELQGFDPAAFDETLRNKLNEEQTPDPTLNPKIDPYEWKTDYTPVDWDVNYNEVPKGYGWGVSTDSPILPYQGGAGGGISGSGPSSPSGRGRAVPDGQGDKLTTRGSAGLQKPLVDFKPSPTEYVKGYDPAKTFYEKPGVVNKAVEDLKAVATDGLALGEKWIDAITGKTAADFKPRNPKESALFNKFKKGYEIFIAAVKEGGGVFGGTLYETGGGRTTMPSKTGEVPQAHFPNVLKTLRKVFAGEKDPTVMQEYGDLHWATIVATISLANTYGPIVWAIPGLRTMADTIGASMNGMLMDKPNLEGNPVQDTMHRLFWIAGQAGQKVYENSVGKIIEKLRGTPKSEKTRGTISEELDDLINIKDAFKGHKSFKRVKVSGGVPAGAKHLQPRGYANPNLPQPEQPRQPRKQKIPTGQPVATSPTRDQPIDDREEFKGIAGKVQGGTIGGKPTGEIPTGRGKDKLRELEQEQEERLKLGEQPPTGGQTSGGDTDEKGKGLDQPLNFWLPIDRWGNQYGEDAFDPENIEGIEYRPHWPKEGEGEEFEREANRLGDQWTAAQGTGEPDPTDPTEPKREEPDWNQVRGADGEIYDKNPNGWKNPSNPSEGLINRNDPSTWDSGAQWDQGMSEWERNDLPSNHPQHMSNQPDHLKPPEGSPGGGGIFADFRPTNAQVESAARDAGVPQGGVDVLFHWTDWEGVPQEGYFNVPISVEGSGRNWSWEYDYGSSGAPFNARPAYGERSGGNFTVEPGP